MSKFLTPNDSTVKSIVESTIEKNDGMITALESMVAMYCPPSTNVLCDNTSRSIRVEGDTVIAPDLDNPGAHKKEIIQAVGCLLDNISDRVDKKLDQFQYTNVTSKDLGRCNDNPAHGNVTARYEDANGDPITVYDSGIVDHADTNAARAKVFALRDAGIIPAITQKQTYFTDQDDITAGVDTTPDPTDANLAENTTDVSDTINEYATMVDLYDEMNGSTTMGCDLLRSQGFDFVKPLERAYQEAATKSDKEIKPEDLRYLRFDNTNILKAIKLLNEARAEQNVTNDNFSFKVMVSSQKYQQAIDCLNKQFDARINFRFFSEKADEDGMNEYTMVFREYKNHITISKAKGFQLNKMPIDIMVIGPMITALMKTDSKLFGQTVISVALHEIFHNIFFVLYEANQSLMASVAITMNIASGMTDAKEQRKFITKYVNSLEKFGNMKLNLISKRALIKKLTLVACVNNDKGLQELQKKLSETNNKSDEELTKLVLWYENYVKEHSSDKVIKKYRKRAKVNLVFAIACLAVSGVLSVSGNKSIAPITLMGAFGFGVLAAGDSLIAGVESAYATAIANDPGSKEESYCDLFAAMYKLPVTFFLGFGLLERKITANEVTPELLQRLVTANCSFSKMVGSKYPTVPERCHASVTVAQNILKCEKDLAPEFKEYLQYIVDNFSTLKDTDIDTNYNDKTFDPKDAEDLDQHLQNIINDSNNKRVEVTD